MERLSKKGKKPLIFVLLLFLPVFLLASEGREPDPRAGGEWAYPVKVPEQDPPPTVLWGPFQMRDYGGIPFPQWGLYGLTYHALKDTLYGVYFWSQSIKRWRSLNPANPASPETVPVLYIQGPVGDSFQDLYYCRYDNSIWLHSSKFKRVYKLDGNTGATIRSFPSPATQYPTGIAFNEREKTLYLVDRLYEGVWPCSLFITDTLGTVLQRMQFPNSPHGYSYAGARCLDFDYTNSNPNWPTLLLLYSHFSGSGILVSCTLYECDRFTGSIIRRVRLPDLAGYVNNARGVAWDPRTGDYWIGIMQSPDNYVYKMDGWHTPYTTDVGIMSMVAPLGTCSLGVAVTPRVLVRNFGNTSATFPIRFRIGSLYDQTLTITNLPAGRESLITFPVWTPAELGYLTAKCTTQLSGDMFPTNNSWTEQIQVVGVLFRDVGVTAITQPPPFVDSGSSVAVQCSVKNYGNVAATFDVYYHIGTIYTEVRSKTLSPGLTDTVNFPNWQVISPRGSYGIRCSTHWALDENPANNYQDGNVTIRVRDVGATVIVSPPSAVDSASQVIPACTVYNYGTTPETYNVRMKIGAFYEEIASVSNHNPGERRYIEFPVWNVNAPRGTYAVSCSTELTPDAVPINDKATSSVSVQVKDVGVSAILSPPGVIPTGTYTPSVEVVNYGSVNAENFRIIYHISEREQLIYADTTFITLSPGQTDTIEFSDWTVNDTGTYSALSRTELVGDANPANDEARRTIRVLPPRRDVGVSWIVSPTGEIPPGLTTPEVYVNNYGTYTVVDFPVIFWIQLAHDQIYADTQIVNTPIPPGDSALITFDDWNATQGVYNAFSWTTLTDDEDPTNDTAEITFEVITHDVGTTAIISPSGQIGVNFPITPRTIVRNFGSVNEDFPVIFQISNGGIVYADTQNITLPAGRTDTVEFDDWTPTITGTYNTLTYTTLAGDMNLTNDTTTGTCEVVSEIHRDVGVVSILYPVGTVPPGNITPQAKVKNFGNVQEASFKVFFTIHTAPDQIYVDSLEVENLAPNMEYIANFASWLTQPGSYTDRCSTYLAVDEDPENDTLSAEFTVPQFDHDVSVIEIITPTGNIQPGTQVIPRIKVHNFGTATETFKTYFRIWTSSEQIYTDSVDVTSLPPDSTRELTFSPWFALSGSYEGVANTALTGDLNPANDTLKEPFTVLRYNYDVGPIRIVSPTGTLPPGNVAPTCSVYNFGNRTATFKVFFKITSTFDQAYLDSAEVLNLAPNRAREVSFTIWSATVGTYQTLTYTRLAGDEYPGNDSLRGTVTIRPAITGWQLVGNVPMTPDNKRIKSGGGMTKCGDYLYILKGNNTRSLYKYTPDANLAIYEDSVPPGVSGKKVKKGAAIISDGRYLYILKGANTREFFRYDTQRGETIWIPLADVPLGAGKALKGGTGVAYVPGFIYLLKGSKTNEFYRFNIAENRWETPNQPVTEKGFKDGSCLVAYNDTLLYCLQGNYNNFYLYNARKDSWYSKRSMPLYHPQLNRKKKAKEGAAMTIYNGMIYAFKGGNTGEFWSYNPTTDTWIGKDTISRNPDRKRVKGGGALVATNGDIFALKGNNTTSIWKYTEADIFFLPQLLAKSITTDIVQNAEYGMRIIQNPTRTPISIFYTLPKKEPATLRIYNSLGELVYNTNSDRGFFVIKNLPAGIYILRFTAKDYTEDRKLIVVR